MGVIEAIVYGIVQGFTEWLPISSTAHLRLLPVALGQEDPGAAFTAVIQLGTLLAVFIYFGKDLWRILKGWSAGLGSRSARETLEYKLGWGILLGTVPVVVCGLLLKDRIESDFRSLNVIGATLIVMGVVLAVAEKVGRRARGDAELTLKDGIWVGLWQAIALIPGASRSGSCISGGLFAGLERATAARFAFLLSAPSILAAGVYSAYSHRKEIGGDMLGPVLIANVFSFAVGLASIAFLMKFLQKRSTAVFIWYRIALGLVILVLVQAGTLDPVSGWGHKSEARSER